MISPAMIASLVFGLCGFLAAVAVEFLLRQFAEDAGVSSRIMVAVPALFAMLFALLLYQDAQRKIRRVGESVSRGILIALLTWLAFSLLAAIVACPAQSFGRCTRQIMLASAIVGGGPMLAAALLGGVLTGVIIIRPPRQPRIEES